MWPPYPEETNMSPTIRSLVIPVSNLDAAKALYTALLGGAAHRPALLRRVQR